MKKLIASVLLTCSFVIVFGQPYRDKIKKIEEEIKITETHKSEYVKQLEEYKLLQIGYDLEQMGLPTLFPGEQLVKHAAFYLDYAEKYEVARWVAHIILPDVTFGTITRTNDFRVDSSVTTGSSVEADYFLKFMKPDSSYTYDGFGYDRGHLAPSADFRWSASALSESYFYSNMSPQLPEFNREGWGELEDAIRGYMYRNPKTQLYVITGPILNDSLPRIERGVNKVAIPQYFWKVAYDPAKQRAIAFLMPNAKITKPLGSYAITLGELEKKTGLQFFTKLSPDVKSKISNSYEIKDWLPEKNFSDVEVMDQELLPRNFFNTEVSKNYMNGSEEITVVGTVVGARLSKAGNILLNLDKQFPKQIFTVFIRKENIPNFSYKPEEFFKGKQIYVKGRVVGLGGVPAMFITSENAIGLFPPTKK